LVYLITAKVIIEQHCFRQLKCLFFRVLFLKKEIEMVIYSFIDFISRAIFSGIWVMHAHIVITIPAHLWIFGKIRRF